MYIWLIRPRDRYPARPAMAGLADTWAEAAAQALRQLLGEPTPCPASPIESWYQMLAIADDGRATAEPGRGPAIWA